MRVLRSIRLDVLVWLSVWALPLAVAAQSLSPPGEGASVANGDEIDVAVIAFEISGDVQKPLLVKLYESVRDGMDKAGARGLDMEQTRAALADDVSLLDECGTPECLQTLRERVGARRFVRVTIASGDLRYTIDIELLVPGREPMLARRIQNSCEACSVSDLLSTVRGAMADLLTPQATVTVGIASEPPGATLTVGGEPKGEAPWKGPLEPGEYLVRASLPGYELAQLPIEVGNGDAGKSFDVPLIRLDIPTARRPYRVVKWLLGGATLGAVGAGITWHVAHGRGTCDRGTCREVYDTRILGYAAVGVGAILGGVTVWMWSRDRRDARPRSATLAPTPGGAVVGINLEF